MPVSADSHKKQMTDERLGKSFSMNNPSAIDQIIRLNPTVLSFFVKPGFDNGSSLDHCEIFVSILRYTLL